MSASSIEPFTSLPSILAGPLLRRQEADRLVLWLVGSRPLRLTMRLRHAATDDPTAGFNDYVLDDSQCQVIAIGRHAFIHLIDLQLDAELPRDTWIDYDLLVDGEGGIAEWAPHLLYEGHRYPNFVVRSSIDHLLHGSCRK
ncbi:isoleucyl-tRNA synthetase, partial [Pseudomonas syringae pv. syringae FF5]